MLDLFLIEKVDFYFLGAYFGLSLFLNYLSHDTPLQTTFIDLTLHLYLDHFEVFF